MNNWLSEEPIKVSVCCITYNHKNYIEVAIDSFLSQKTTFPFEIIIGDDCSNDGTSQIVDNYQKCYPNIIKVLRGETNKGMIGNMLATLSAANSDYIAFCEGDDYWVDNDKLTKQKNICDKDDDISLCIHPCYRLGKNGKLKKSFSKAEVLTFYSATDVVNIYGQFAPSSSYFFRKSVISDFPCWLIDAPLGDLFIELYATKSGNICYIPEYMSIYRVFSENSWTDINRRSLDKIIDNCNRMLPLLNKCADELKVDFSSKISAVRLSLAYAKLIKRHFEQFKMEITISYHLAKRKSKMQLFFYFFREYPKILRYIILFKKKVDLHIGRG